MSPIPVSSGNSICQATIHYSVTLMMMQVAELHAFLNQSTMVRAGSVVPLSLICLTNTNEEETWST